MKKIIVGAAIGTALAAAIAIPPVNAADLARGYSAPAPYSAFSWAGLYAGANYITTYCPTPASMAAEHFSPMRKRPSRVK